MRTTRVTLALFTTLALMGCEDSGTGPASTDAAVAGDVQETTAPAEDSRDSEESAGSTSTSEAGAEEEARSVTLGSVRSDGTIDILAEADVSADGSFRIENVPAGRSDLVVVARGESGEAVGRVMVHGETATGSEIRVQPIDVRTTARGRVHAHLHSTGRAARARTSEEMALYLHLQESAAVAVASSRAQIEAVAEAYVEAQSAMTGVLAELEADLDPEARAELFAGLAADYAATVAAGGDVESAYEAYATAAVDAMLGAGVDVEALSVATAGAATALSRTSADAELDATARAQVSRAATKLNLLARERVAARISSESALHAEAQALASTIAQSRSSLTLLLSVSDVSSVLESTFSACETLVVEAVLDLTTDLSTEARADLEAALSDAFARADLRVALEGSASASSIQSVAAAYYADVQAAAQTVVDAMAGSDANLSVEAMAALLIAAGAGGHVSS